jgi:hypothetical protein
MRILPRRSGIGSRIPDPEAKIEPFENLYFILTIGKTLFSVPFDV